MSKLNLFTSTGVGDNTNVALMSEATDTQPELLIGGSYSHYFSLPFICSEVLKELSICYVQGTNQVLTNYPAEISEDNLSKCSYVNFTLGPDETALFRATLQDTFCQLKMITLNGDIYFSDPKEIIVKSTLFSKEEE